MYRLLTFIGLLLFSQSGHSQIDPLKDTLTISFDGSTTMEALEMLSRQSQYHVSYNPDRLPKKEIYSTYQRESIETILKGILGAGFNFKVHGSYIIIQVDVSESTSTPIHINGEVLDAVTGERLANTRIYEVSRLSATLSNEDGSYHLASRPDGDKITLAISKENYKDTVITVDKTYSDFLSLLLEPIHKTEITINSIKQAAGLFIDKREKKHIEDIPSGEDRWAQLSLVPGVSTNGQVSSQVTNHISLNILAGYAGGVDGVELGMFNANRGQVRGLQIAGLANTAGGDIEGLQIGGAFNLSKSEMKGFQATLGANAVSGSAMGVQMALAANYSADLSGLQASMGANVAEDVRGMQASWGYNLARDTLMGIQMALGANMASNTSGAQLALGYNHAHGKLTGAQLGSVMNYTHHSLRGMQATLLYNHVGDTLKGLQLGTVNSASTLKGVQVGLVNMAEKVESGTMFGLVNLAKGEVIALDIDYNDVTEFNMSFKSGVKHFYTIITSGISYEKNFWTSGFGFGSQQNIAKFLYMGVELTGHTLLPSNQQITSVPINGRFNISLGGQITERMSIHAGPVLHYLYFYGINDRFNPMDLVGTNPLLERSSSRNSQKLWLGYRIGLRI